MFKLGCPRGHDDRWAWYSKIIISGAVKNEDELEHHN